MTKIKYAIPSYRRGDSIAEKTLSMLSENGIHPDDVTIFVSDHSDMLAYRKLLKYGYHIYNTSSDNVVHKFNSIHRHYPIGTPVVFIEDDIESLSKKGPGKNDLLSFTELPIVAEKMFTMCQESQTKLWGISSNANPFYMKDQCSYGFKFIVANLFGFISTRDSFLEVSQQMKSDYERTLLYFVRFGGVCRADGICAITRNYKNDGGLQEIKDLRADLEEKGCRYLVRRFPHLIEINEKKSGKSMYMELRMKTQKKNVLNDWMAIQKQIDKELSCST